MTTFELLVLLKSLSMTVFSSISLFVKRENSSVESILSLSGVHRLSTNFRFWRKKKRCVKKCKTSKGRVKDEEKRSDDHDHVDGVGRLIT